MNIFLISSGIWEYDGRLRELTKVAKQLGSTKYLTGGNSFKSKQDNNHITILQSGVAGYLSLIYKSIIEAIKFKKIEVLLIDNRKAIIPGLIIKLLRKPKNIILDVRELYTSKEVTHLTGKIGCYLETIMIRKADIVICANKYRSSIMKEYYELEQEPLIFENIRKLEDVNKNFFKELDEKYSNLFKKNTVKIISTSGTSISRTNDKLVNAMKKLDDRYELFLVGGGSEIDGLKIRELVKKNELNNVHFIDKVNAGELQYLIKNCDIGIVNYHQKDLNNKYCASGKIFEFLLEGLPIVTTENIPLMEICNSNNIGISDNNYWRAITTVAENYNYYKENVKVFGENINAEENNLELTKRILSLLRK